MEKEFDILFKLMLLTGIDIGNNSEKKRLLRFITILGAALTNGVIMHSLITLIYYFSLDNYKYFITAITFRVLFLFLWYIVFKARRQFIQVILSMAYLINAIFPNKKPCYKHTMAILCFLILAHPLIWMIANALTINEADALANNHYFFSASLSDYGIFLNQSILNLYLFILFSVTYLLPNTVSLMYVFLCIYMRCILCRFNNMVKFANVTKSYEITPLHTLKGKIVKVIRMMESVFALTALMLTIINTLLLFLTLAIIFGFIPRYGLTFDIFLNYSTINSTLSFFAMAFFAAEVHQNQIYVQNSLEMMSHCSCTLLMDTRTMSLIQSMCRNETAVLTAYGMFEFTRGFIPAACGSILTYSLLILQLRT